MSTRWQDVVGTLKLVRLSKGWSISKLASEAGATQQAVSAFESMATNDVMVSTLSRYANALGYELELRAVPRQTHPS